MSMEGDCEASTQSDRLQNLSVEPSHDTSDAGPLSRASDTSHASHGSTPPEELNADQLERWRKKRMSFARQALTVAISPRNSLVNRRISCPSALQTPSPLNPVATACPVQSSMLKFGVHSIQGMRKTMEDAHSAVPHMNEGLDQKSAEDTAFFGVYDGHGGTQAADYVRNHLHTNVVAHPLLGSDAETALKEAFAKTEKEFNEWAIPEQVFDGTTAAVALLCGDKTKLVVGNVGDSEIVLCRDGVAVGLTRPHNLKKNSDEEKRVVECGGQVYKHRLAHPKFNPSIFSLGVSRAIGDVFFKDPQFTKGKVSGLVADADVETHTLTDEDQFIIIGCDGLWDVMSHQDAVDLALVQLKDHGDATRTSESLVAEAFEKGSTDNITVLVVAFQPFECRLPHELTGIDES